MNHADAWSDVALDGPWVRLSEAGGRVVAQATARAARWPVRMQVAAACWSEPARPRDADDASAPTRVTPGARALGPGLLHRAKAVPLALDSLEVALTVTDLVQRLRLTEAE